MLPRGGLEGYRINFGEIQAAIVRHPYKASATDNPWVHGKTLLAKAGSSSMVMRDAFRHQPHWKELIVSGGARLLPSEPYGQPYPSTVRNTCQSISKKNMGEHVG